MKKILLLLMGLIPLLGIGQKTQGITFETGTLKSSTTELSPKTNHKVRANVINPARTNISKETNLTITGLCETPPDQDFGSFSDITYGPSLDYQCITYSGSDCSVAIGNISSEAITASPAFSGSAAVIVGNSAGGYGEFYSTNGYNFKLVSLVAEFFGHSNGNCSEIYNVVGYRDNDEVVRADNFSVLASGTAGTGTATITWDRVNFDTDGSNSGVLSFGTGWQNIDKIRFEMADGTDYWVYIGLDNIDFEVAVSASIPTIATASITIFNATSATMGGEVTADGGASVTERGVVYSSSDNSPEIGETGVIKNDNGTGTGIFGESVSGLSPNTTYHVRAYAINSAGTAYGDDVTFTTVPAADPLQTVYWPNYEGDKIEGISITGTNRATVASTAEMDPISIEIDAENDKVYWLSQSDTKIYRADTDGSNIETFVADPGYATTLFLDRKNGYLYWPNYEAAKIERIKIDGSSREDVASTPQPIAVTVDLTNDKVYWFDQDDYKIHRADLDGSNSEIFVTNPVCYNIIL